MSKFNWDDHPIETDTKTEASDKSESQSFNWDDHPLESQHNDQPQPKQSVGGLRSALVGAGQGATLGFGEELTAPFVAAAGMGSDSGNIPNESTWDKYQRLMQTYRDTAREEQKGAQEQHPYAYTAGALAGGLAAPGLGAGKVLGTVGTGLKGAPLAARLAGKAIAGSGVGAGLGALGAAGEAEGGMQERLAGASEGVLPGALLGAAVPLGGEALSALGKGASKVAELPVISDTLKNFQRGLKGQNLITSKGRREAADLVREESGNLYNDINELKNNIGKDIGNAVDSASESGEKVDLSAEVPAVLAKLQKIKAEGSKEAASYAASVESEIRKVLGLKAPQLEEDIYKNAPEGFIKPKAEPDLPEQILVDPKKAQDLKQVLQDYSPRKGMAPQELEPARVAKGLKNEAGEQLSETAGLGTEEATPENPNPSPGLNEQYGLVKDALKRLSLNETKLPEQIKSKINGIVSGLEKENLSGDNARAAIDDVLSNIEQVAPDIAAKYKTSFDDLVERLNLANRNFTGSQSHSILGIPRAVSTTTGNAAGLVANKMGVNKIAPAAASFADTIMKNSTKAAVVGLDESPGSISRVHKATEPYAYQRQVASAAESADPETLKEQAGNIRKQYGSQGEQLAMILDNMADKDKDARRALMFTIGQNPAYRKMLGLMGEEK